MSLQEVVQKMLNQVYPELIDPNSQYYLPKFVKANGYDPYGPFDWNNVPLNTSGVASISQQICQDAYPPTETWIPATDKNPNITLSLNSSNIAGLSGIQLPQAPQAGGADGTTVTVSMQYLSPIILNGNFSLTQWCCPSNDSTTCSGADAPSTGTGTYTATINSAAVVVIFAITTIEEGELDLGNFEVTFAASPTPPNMTITAVIETIPPGIDRDTYDKLASEALNDPTFLTNIVQQINVTMNSADALSKLQNILTAELDDYLKSNHLYPFDNASAAVY